MTTNISRIPRPLGLTILSLNYQKSQSEEDKERLYKHLITQYTLSGFRYLNQPINISKFSNLMNIPESTIMQYVSTISKDIGAFNSPDQMKDTLTSIASMSMNWSIEDRGLAMAQLSILAQAQGNSYKPFISSEVTRSLKLAQDANTNLMNLYKTFFTSNQTNILNIYNNTNKDNSGYLNPEEALNIINEQKAIQMQARKELSQGDKTKYDPIRILQDDELDLLYEEHKLGDSPECLENRSGTQALMAAEPLGPLANTPIGQPVTEPESLKAPRKKSRDRHENFEERRNEQYVHFDEVEE